MAPRRRCPICGSRQWHKEPSSGLIACSEGHVLQNYRNEAKEVDEMGPHAVRKRALKSVRKKKEKEGGGNPNLYHGPRARFHYFQCQQVILRHQIAALRKLWELPPEFEVICRDVWALHLSLLTDPPSPEPYLYFQDIKSGTSSRTMVDEESNRRPHPERDPEGNSHPAKSHETETSSGSDDEEKTADEDLAELLRENSGSSSSSDGEDRTKAKAREVDAASDSSADETAPRKRRTKQRKIRKPQEGPASSVAVLVLACWTLRVPILYCDFARMIESYDLPYLDPLRYLPQSMSVHLTKHNIQALSPAHPPDTLSLHALVSRLARRLYSSYGILTPEANAAPILWRAVRCLGGTPTLYTLTKRLADVLSLPLTLHYSLAPGLIKTRRYDPESHKYDNVPPELGFAAVVIVVLKMVYGLDGQMRLPEDVGDPACSLPRIDEYLKTLKELDEADRRRKDADFHSRKPMSVTDLSDDMVDEYLEFCERALLGSDDELRGRDILNRYFPIGDEKAATRAQHATLAEGDNRSMLLEGTLLNEGDEALRPGEKYRIYKSQDVLGSVPEEYGMVISRVSEWVRVEEEYVNKVVEKYERRMAAQRRLR